MYRWIENCFEKILFSVSLCLIGNTTCIAQSITTEHQIPSIYEHVITYQNGKLVLRDPDKGINYRLRPETPRYQLQQFSQPITGTKRGLKFNFGQLNGTLFYGLIDNDNRPHPLPVYYKYALTIDSGEVEVDIAELKGKYDLSGWKKKGKGELGYRVLNNKGEIIFDGQVAFIVQENGFRENITFTAAPTIHNITASSAVLAFETNFPSNAIIRLNNRIVAQRGSSKRHEIVLNDLNPAEDYHYHIDVSAQDKKSKLLYYNQRHSIFRTAPSPGTRAPFVFAYASDSRNGQGGGERNIYGVNAYIMKKIMALSVAKGAAFLQFSGDMIDGRSNSIGEQKLQYRNWLQCISPFANQLPVYATMGNHEGLFHTFNDGSKTGITVDRFPFATQSAEAVFSDLFVLPENGPISEDGASYDPDHLSEGDFPPYKETVYSYEYDNVAMVVLNSNYLFSRSFKYWFSKKGASGSPLSGGGLHGYIMDQQLKWLGETLKHYQQDNNIDFVFVTLHTPFFPNGGHKSDAMWYDGSNTPRPWISGKALNYGIVEQRDRLLKLLDNHTKVVAVLTGDEHNYARTLITPESIIHKSDYQATKKVIRRPIWQINNGAAGAPYYAQEKLPWSDSVARFSMQHALVLFYVDGKQIHLEVIDPDTLSKVD
ncbi:metallophosphoesterase [bacterium AH-315-K03]|nr:metallophosphoesterase [bacterium AH-315-K03]